MISKTNIDINSIYAFLLDKKRAEIKSWMEYLSSLHSKISLSSDKEIKSIKIRNACDICLHLRGIELFKEGKKLSDKELPRYQLKMGAQQFSYPKKLNFSELAPDSILHTMSGKDNNHLIVNFEEPISIDEIVVYSATGRRAQVNRTNFLSVELAYSDDSSEKVLDNHSFLMSNKNALAGELKTAYPDVEFAVLDYLCSLFIQIEYGSFISGFKLDRRICANSQLNFDELKSVINERLRPKKLQFTEAHGITKTFNLYTKVELFNYIHATKRFIDILHNVTPNAFYAFGTLLGFIREPNYFIPHDNDIDIIGLFKTSDFPTRNALTTFIVDYLSNFPEITILSVFIDHMNISYNGSHRIDFFHCLEDHKGNIDAYPQHRGKYLNSSFLYPTINMNVFDVPCPIPKNPFEYLDVVYGKTWKTPIDKNFHTKD